MTRIEPIFARRLARISIVSACVAASLATASLLGWFAHLPLLTSLAPGLATMKVNAATGLLACALALLVRDRAKPRGALDRVGDTLAVIAFALGGLTLLEYAVGRSFGIDQLLFNHPAPPGQLHPGRMSIATATGLSLVATGIFLLDRLTRVSQFVVIGGLVVCSLGLIGYLYGIESLYRTYPFSSMGLNTAIALALLSVSHLTARSRRCIHQLLVANTVGGTMTRRLLPAIVIVPLAIGWLRLQGQRFGLYDTPFGIAIFALSTILILAGIVWWNATLLDQADADRRRLEADHDDLLIREQSARARAERAVLVRDQLLAVVSHELRTPLTPALLTATALEHRTQLPLDVQEDVHLIREQIEIEAHLIDDLLDVASLNQGKLVLKREMVDLHALAHTVAASQKKKLLEHRVQLTIALESKSPRVLGDEKRLQQIVANLIGNAIKFTPPGGTIRLCMYDTRDDQIAIEINDSGVGIEPEALDRIFDAFEQADPTTTRQFGGLGIGLTISRLLVKLHGGTLTASSEGTSRGASFTVQLPRAIPPAGALAPTEAPEQLLRRLSILLVDDNPQIVAAMRVLLKSRVREIVTATSAQGALAAVQERAFDLIISDLGLPDLSGWELMRQLRKASDIRGIAISGFVDEADRRKSLESGYSVHLAKPIDLRQLLSAIESAATSPPAADHANSPIDTADLPATR